MPLEAKNVSFRYGPKSPCLLRHVDFTVHAGQRVGIIAPSGYGKTTLVGLLAGYQTPTGGEILLDGKPLPAKGPCPVQLICQHPEHAINPRWKMRKVLEEAGIPPDTLPEALGIEPAWLDRWPRELSGGELQRFCVARALAPGTRYIIADEISTMLDVLTQAQLWHYLLAETEKRHIGLVAVTHNAALAQRICTRVVDLRTINKATPREEETI